ncbi:MAG: Phosphate-selective porin [Myxococcaceae bacterium]|nr:Phosphate-selective porin [Myxococcaceae bacterium]
MFGRNLVTLTVLAWLTVRVASTRAQEVPSTDPTEPTHHPALLTIPLPSEPALHPPAQAAAPADSAPPPPASEAKANPTAASAAPAEPIIPAREAPNTAPEPNAVGPEPNNIDFGADNEGDEVALPGDPFGDTAADGLVTIRALFQARYISTSSSKSHSARQSYRLRENYLDQQNDGYSLNRIFLRIGSDPSKYVGFKTLLDFSELLDGDPEDVVKQAYASLRPIPNHLELTVGLFKLPFSTLELDASSRFEFSEYGQANKLGGNLGFSGRDLGVQLIGAPFKKAKRLRLTLGAYRGHAKDEHDSPLGVVAGRAEAKPNKHWRLGADIVQHTETVSYDRPFDTSKKDQLPSPPDPLYPAQKRWLKGRAFSADLRYKKKSLMMRGEGQYGDRVDRDTRYGAKTWFAAWGLVAYRVDVTDTVRLLPAVRFEWFDADREHKDRGVQQQLSFATTVLFWDRVRFLLEATRVHVQGNTAVVNQPKPIQLDPYLALSHVRVIAQLQLEL